MTADLSTSPTQTRTTGADGKVVFAGLEPSAIPVNDPKYKYRLTVGLTDPWVTHPDSVPARGPAAPHGLADLDDPTLKVFKQRHRAASTCATRPPASLRRRARRR